MYHGRAAVYVQIDYRVLTFRCNPIIVYNHGLYYQNLLICINLLTLLMQFHYSIVDSPLIHQSNKF